MLSSNVTYEPGVNFDRQSQDMYQIYFKEGDEDDEEEETVEMDLGAITSSRFKDHQLTSIFSDKKMSSSFKKEWNQSSMIIRDEMEVELGNGDRGKRGGKKKEEERKRKIQRTAYQASMTAIQTEVRTGNGKQDDGSDFTTIPLVLQMEELELGLSKTSQKRIHIRRPSDLELLLPRSQRKMEKRKCCSSSSDITSWTTRQKVVCLVLSGLFLVLCYAFIMVAIIKGLGGG